MREHQLGSWFRIVSALLILFGIVYLFAGLRILPVQRNLLQWESALYGAIMIGWGTTLLMVARIAFRQRSRELKQALMVGLTAWLLVEAAASAWYGVWFNVGVDAAVLLLFGIPLLSRTRDRR